MPDNNGGSLGGGSFFGNLGPSGSYGAWPGCGCGSGCLMIAAGMLLVFGGLLRWIGL